MLVYKLASFAQQALEAWHDHPIATAQVRATTYQDDNNDDNWEEDIFGPGPDPDSSP